MKKINNNGYMLVETLICSVFIITILTLIFVEFRSLNQNYQTSFKYNTVNNLYLTNQIRSYIKENNYNEIKNIVKSNNYVDLSTCQSSYFSDTNYCTNLFKNSNVKQIIVGKSNLDSINNVSSEFSNFINKVNLIDDGIVIYIEFNDQTFSMLKML